FTQYLDEYENNTQLRASSESYLTVNNPEISYENNLLELQSRSIYLDIGLEKIRKGLATAKNLEFNKLPGPIANQLNEINDQLQIAIDQLQHLRSVMYVTEILGTYESKTYLILLHDNTRPK